MMNHQGRGGIANDMSSSGANHHKNSVISRVCTHTKYLFVTSALNSRYSPGRRGGSESSPSPPISTSKASPLELMTRTVTTSMGERQPIKTPTTRTIANFIVASPHYQETDYFRELRQ